ncbi:MAG: hypothetical protein AAF212_06485, partial [Verrucomicrobiota bacterium]
QIKLSGGKSHVVSLKQRAQAIEFLEEILSPEYNAEEPAFEDLKDPFYPESEEEPELIPEPVVMVVPKEPEPTEVDPMDVLESAGEELKSRIRGTLSAGSNFFVTTADGTFIGAGSEIPFTFQDETYIIVVERVSDESFTLLLQNLRRRVSILDAAR